jgi:hypothetical protein
LIATNRAIHCLFYIGRPDGQTWVELHDYVTNFSVELGDTSGVGAESSGADGMARTLTFTLKNRQDYNFSPRDRNSPWNQFNGQYAPLIWPNREVMIKVAVLSLGFLPVEADWLTIFHGYLGDSIKPNAEDGTLVCQCRDLSKRLQDTYIETVRTYGSDSGILAETVIQQIINDNLGTGQLGTEQVSLYCPVATGFMITPYRCEYQTIWDAIQQIVSQFGWWCGYKLDSTIGQFRLMLLQPPRTKTSPDFTLDYMDDFYVEELEIKDTDIRNVVTVSFTDKSTGKPNSITVFDQDSINEFGRKAMTIGEKNTSLIDTPSEAFAMGNSALDDLKNIIGSVRIEMPFFPQMDIFSCVEAIDSRISSTQDFYAVTSIRHSLDFDGLKFRTEIVGSGQVVGAHIRWLKMETRPGSPGYPDDILMPKSFGIIAYMIYQDMRQVVHRWSTFGDILGVEIRRLDPSNLNWEFGQIVNTRVIGSKYIDNNISIGRSVYGIRAIGKNGLYSDMITDDITVNSIPMANIIVAFNAFPELNGTLTDCYKLNNRIILDVIDYCSDNTDDLCSDITDVYCDTPTMEEGIYETEILSLGRNLACEVRINDIRYTNGKSIWWRFADSIDGISATQWREFSEGRYSFNYYQWQIKMDSAVSAYEELTAFEIGVDVPDIILKFPNEQMQSISISDAASGLAIHFSDYGIAFTRPPGPYGTVKGDTGGYVFATEISETSATIKAKDSAGNLISGELASLQFVGY